MPNRKLTDKACEFYPNRQLENILQFKYEVYELLNLSSLGFSMKYMILKVYIIHKLEAECLEQ